MRRNARRERALSQRRRAFPSIVTAPRALVNRTRGRIAQSISSAGSAPAVTLPAGSPRPRCPSRCAPELEEARTGGDDRLRPAERLPTVEKAPPVGPSGEDCRGEELPPVRVAAQHEARAHLRGLRNAAGVVVQHDHRRGAVDCKGLRRRAVVVHPVRPADEREVRQAHRFVVQQPDVRFFEKGAQRFAVRGGIVVAQHGKDTLARADAAQRPGDGIQCGRVAEDLVVRIDDVPADQHHVGFDRVDLRHDPSDVRLPDERAQMDVADEGDAAADAALAEPNRIGCAPDAPRVPVPRGHHSRRDQRGAGRTGRLRPG